MKNGGINMDNIELARFYDDEKQKLITITVSDYNKN